MPGALLVSLPIAEFLDVAQTVGRTGKSGCLGYQAPIAPTSSAMPHYFPMGVWMPDLSVAHSVLRALRQPQSPNNAPLGTGRRHESILKSMNVPVVPRVPNQNEPLALTGNCI
jgi:hypothetical protein